jgi:hypothetical protein
MSSSDQANASFATLASEIAAACANAIEQDKLDDIPDDSLGQIIGAAIRLYAAKAQHGQATRPFGRNGGVTVTDVAIGCTALMDCVGLQVFELGAGKACRALAGLPNHPNPIKTRGIS